MSSVLEEIITNGNRSNALGNYRFGENWITCADGARISVIAGWGAHCSPRPGDPIKWGGAAEDFAGPYTHVEAWPQVPMPAAWHEYVEGAESTCLAAMSPTEDCTCTGPSGNVPIDLVRKFIELHGGAR